MGPSLKEPSAKGLETHVYRADPSMTYVNGHGLPSSKEHSLLTAGGSDEKQHRLATSRGEAFTAEQPHAASLYSEAA